MFVVMHGKILVLLVLAAAAFAVASLDCSKPADLPRIVYPTRIPPVVGEWPPRQIPANLLSYYTRCGSIPTDDMFIDDSRGGKGTHYKFSSEQIQVYVDAAINYRRRPRTVSVKLMPIFTALTKHSVNGSSVVVVGSAEPWYEAILIAFGAKHVVTVEYNQLTYNHTHMTTVTPDIFKRDYLSVRYDYVFAINAVDHDGLGRYGDPLAPDGDLLDMDEWATWLSPTGLLVLTLPIGPDLVVWNLERRYGTIRLPLLLNGFERVDTFGWDQNKFTQPADFRKRYEPVFILRPNTTVTNNNAAQNSEHEELR